CALRRRCRARRNGTPDGRLRTLRPQIAQPASLRPSFSMVLLRLRTLHKRTWLYEHGKVCVVPTRGAYCDCARSEDANVQSCGSSPRKTACEFSAPGAASGDLRLVPASCAYRAQWNCFLRDTRLSYLARAARRDLGSRHVRSAMVFTGGQLCRNRVVYP